MFFVGIGDRIVPNQCVNRTRGDTWCCFPEVRGRAPVTLALGFVVIMIIHNSTNCTNRLMREELGVKIGFVATILVLVLCILNTRCSSKYAGKTFVSQSGGLYVKFLDSKTIEWKWSSEFRPELFDYSIDKDRIKAIRRVLGLGQVWHISIIDDKLLADDRGNKYILSD